MFFATYRNTLKTLVRSALLWVMFVLLLAVAIYKVSVPNYGMVVVENDIIIREITDLEDEFEMTRGSYVQALRNNFGHLSYYAVPLFSIVSVMLVLSRDCKDSFFEIEKAGGVKPRTYFFGRLAAILTVNIVLVLVAVMFHNHLYCITRDVMGDMSMSLWAYVSETCIRVLRLFFCGMLPGMLFYIGLTYMAGSLFKSGFFGTVVSSSWVLLVYALGRTAGFRMSTVNDFLDPLNHKFYMYWGYYDTEWFTEKTIHNPWSAETLLVHTALVVGIAVLGFAVSYICIRKRKV
ncbi:MAG: hypothetical protein IJ457_08750 [Clostridia bacterium]|nr:hypothetical protein [Clostridia bacterium]